MKFMASIWKVTGNAVEVKSEVLFNGEVDFVPLPNQKSYLMLPVSVLVEKNEFNRRVGIPEIQVFSLFDRELRVKAELTKKETAKANCLKVGQKMEFTRYGWGKEWTNSIERIS